MFSWVCESRPIFFAPQCTTMHHFRVQIPKNQQVTKSQFLAQNYALTIWQSTK